MVGRTKAEISEANRRRYEELRAAGQEATPKALPPATALDGAPIAPQAVISREEVPPGWYDTVRLRRGEALRIVDTSGTSSVSVIGWCEHDRSERINCADTAKVQWSAALVQGQGHPDGHGTGLPVADRGHQRRARSSGGRFDAGLDAGRLWRDLAQHPRQFPRRRRQARAGAARHPALRDLLRPGLARCGRPLRLERPRASGPAISSTCAPKSDLVLVLSNCPHPLDPARPAANGPVTLVRHRAPPAAADDPCRTTSPEIGRAFQFTDRLYA